LVPVALAFFMAAIGAATMVLVPVALADGLHLLSQLALLCGVCRRQAVINGS
jgi:hypothetical protein